MKKLISSLSLTALATIACASFASADTSSISFSQNNFTMTPGQNQTVTITAPGYTYMSVNTTPDVATADYNGNSLTLHAMSGGTDSVTICSAAGGGASCGKVDFTVIGTGGNTSQTANAYNTTTVTSTLALSTTTVNLTPGQTATVTIGNGTQPFYVQTNSNPNVVTANIVGSNINIYALGVGGANITVCSNPNLCGTFYAYVMPTPPGTVNTPSWTSSSTPGTLALPTLTSLIMNASFGNGVYAAGNTITFGFNTSIPVVNPSVQIGTTVIPATGDNAGPYGVTYTLTGNEGQPLPVTINLSTANGITNKIYMVIGRPANWNGIVNSSQNSQNSQNTQGSPTSPTQNTLAANPPAPKAIFNQTLDVGSTGSEVSALQSYLTEMGIYTGPITGKFGSQTKQAVISFQNKHGLKPVGAVGPATRDLLNSSH